MNAQNIHTIYQDLDARAMLEKVGIMLQKVEKNLVAQILFSQNPAQNKITTIQDIICQQFPNLQINYLSNTIDNVEMHVTMTEKHAKLLKQKNYLQHVLEIHRFGNTSALDNKNTEGITSLQDFITLLVGVAKTSADSGYNGPTVLILANEQHYRILLLAKHTEASIYVSKLYSMIQDINLYLKISITLKEYYKQYLQQLMEQRLKAVQKKYRKYKRKSINIKELQTKNEMLLEQEHLLKNQLHQYKTAITTLLETIPQSNNNEHNEDDKNLSSPATRSTITGEKRTIISTFNSPNKIPRTSFEDENYYSESDSDSDTDFIVDETSIEENNDDEEFYNHVESENKGKKRESTSKKKSCKEYAMEILKEENKLLSKKDLAERIKQKKIFDGSIECIKYTKSQMVQTIERDCRETKKIFYLEIRNGVRFFGLLEWLKK
jgi:hypothetical protein